MICAATAHTTLLETPCIYQGPVPKILVADVPSGKEGRRAFGPVLRQGQVWQREKWSGHATSPDPKEALRTRVLATLRRI